MSLNHSASWLLLFGIGLPMSWAPARWPAHYWTGASGDSLWSSLLPPSPVAYSILAALLGMATLGAEVLPRRLLGGLAVCALALCFVAFTSRTEEAIVFVSLAVSMAVLFDSSPALSSQARYVVAPLALGTTVLAAIPLHVPQGGTSPSLIGTCVHHLENDPEVLRAIAAIAFLVMLVSTPIVVFARRETARIVLAMALVFGWLIVPLVWLQAADWLLVYPVRVIPLFWISAAVFFNTLDQ